MGAGVLVMSEKPNNPFAFPSLDDGKHNFESGMTLRDWFAGMAMQGMNANPDLLEVVTAGSIKNGSSFDLMARTAYEIADMMLKHREATS